MYSSGIIYRVNIFLYYERTWDYLGLLALLKEIFIKFTNFVVAPNKCSTKIVRKPVLIQTFTHKCK